MKHYVKNLIFLSALLLFFTAHVVLADEIKEEKKEDVKEENIDVSDLAEDYWRPNRDDLEVIQNRKFEKAGRFELGLNYGVYQGGDYLDSKSVGASLTYHWNNAWATEISTLNVNNKESNFLKSVKERYGFTPDFNPEKSQHNISMLWTPIYAKFSSLGKKISHFETYLGPGIGVTETTEMHFTKIFQIGEKFFINDHLIFRLEWKISQYTDKVNATRGAPSIANGGPGYFQQPITRHNIIFGIAWLF